MQNKKLIALISLSILAVFSLVYGIIAPSKKKHKSSTKPHQVTTQIDRDDVKKMINNKRPQERKKDESYRRNPFVPGGSAKTSSQLVLDGIMWDDKSPKVMINNIIAGIGDKIGKNTVIDIKPGHVTINDGTKNITLRLE